MFIILHTTWYGYLTFPWSKYLVILFTKEFFAFRISSFFEMRRFFKQSIQNCWTTEFSGKLFLDVVQSSNTVWNLIFLDKFKTFAALFQSHFILLPCSLIMTSLLLLSFHFWKFICCKESRVCYIKTCLYKIVE